MVQIMNESNKSIFSSIFHVTQYCSNYSLIYYVFVCTICETIYPQNGLYYKVILDTICIDYIWQMRICNKILYAMFIQILHLWEMHLICFWYISIRFNTNASCHRHSSVREQQQTGRQSDRQTYSVRKYYTCFWHICVCLIRSFFHVLHYYSICMWRS